MTFDPAVLKDPAALTADWKPLRPGGSNFTTHRLVQVGDARMQMKPTLGLLLFGAIFLVVGVGASLGGLSQGEWIMAVFGLPFSAVGTVVLWPKLVAFDREARRFTSRKREVPFSNIHALQVLAEHVSSDDSDYWSYELNVVLTSGERINVVDHAGLERIRREARQLGALIGCAVWDGTQR